MVESVSPPAVGTLRELACYLFSSINTASIMSSTRPIYDLTIIGGGIVGLATARLLSIRHPSLKLCIIEKEKELASHQSKRNSGVVHQGIYYKKNTLKSRFCVQGAQLAKEYCLANNLPFNQCGKLIVASSNDELEELHRLYKNAVDINIPGVKLWTAEQVKELQPECSHVKEAIWSPGTAIVDWQQVAKSYANDFMKNGGEIINNFAAYKVNSVSSDGSLLVEGAPEKQFFLNSVFSKKSAITSQANSPKIIETKTLVNCAGLYSDYFARITGNNEHPKVVPFRGFYYLLSDRLASKIKTNIYPVPDPKLPFLGVHLTPRLDGSVLIGPTASLRLSYEQYTDKDPLKLIEADHIVRRSGLRKLLFKKDYLIAGCKELWRMSSKKSFAKDVQKLLPEVRADDLIDANFSGIRAQTIAKDGQFVDDFLFEAGFWPEFRRVLHVRNCPSPAATSSQPIAERVVKILEGRFI